MVFLGGWALLISEVPLYRHDRHEPPQDVSDGGFRVSGAALKNTRKYQDVAPLMPVLVTFAAKQEIFSGLVRWGCSKSAKQMRTNPSSALLLPDTMYSLMNLESQLPHKNVNLTFESVIVKKK